MINLMKTIVTTEPASQPVTTVQAKAYLRVDGTDEDSVIDGMVLTATRMLEHYLSMKFINQTVDCIFDRFPTSDNGKWWDGSREVPISYVVTAERAITLPISNVTAVTYLKTFSDDAEFSETLSNYVIDTTGKNCRIALKLGSVWPTTVLRSISAVQIRVQAGWANEAAVPSDIKQAIKEFVAHMYENRGDQAEMVMPPHVAACVSHRKRSRLG